MEDSQGERLVPAGVEGGTDGPGLLFGLIFGVRGELELDVGVWESIWVHRDQVPGFTHCREDKATKGRESVHANLTANTAVTTSPNFII